MRTSSIRRWATVAAAALTVSAVAVVVAPSQVGAAGDYDLSAYFLSVDPVSVAPGGSATVSVTVQNEGSVATSGVATVTFTLPTALTLLGGTECDAPVGQQVSCRTDIPVDPMSNRTVSISVERDLVTPGLLGPISATVSGPDADPDPADNTVTNYLGEITDPTHSADVYMTADVNPYPPVAGGSATLTLTVVNQGPDDAVDVVAVPTLGPGWAIVGAPATCTPLCAIGTVPASTSVSLDFTVQVAIGGPTYISAIDNVISGTPDWNQTNGASSAFQVDPPPPPGSISGTILAGTVPVSGAQVSAVNTTTWAWYSDTTDASGDYQIANLPAGNYLVQVQAAGFPSRYYPGVADQMMAMQVAVGTGAVADIDISYPAPTTISGHVDVDGPLPTSVYLSPNGPGMPAFTSTDGSGAYTFTNVAAGTYRVSTSTGPTTWYHPGVSDYMAATLVAVNAGDSLTDIDIVAPDPGAISGMVTDGTTGVAGVTVRVWGPTSWWTPLVSTTTANDGSYNFASLPTDQQLRVEFVSPGGLLLGEWWNDATDRNSATPITLASGEVRNNIDAVLTAAATLSGQVIAADTGLGVPSQVILYRPALGSFVVLTDQDGYFTVTSVVPDTYVLYAQPGPFDPSVYAPEYWGGANSLAAAAPITLVSGQVLTDQDITVDVGATISGTVTDPNDNPVAGTFVWTEQLSGPPGFTVGNVQAWTGADGSYSLIGLVPGDYEVVFEPESLTGLLSEYYPNSYDAAGALPVVAVGDVTGIDAQLETGSFGIVTLRDTNGPINSATVFGAGPGTCLSPAVFEMASISCQPGSGFQPFTVDGAGGWRLGPLAPGTYTTRAVRFGAISGDVVVLTVGSGDAFTCDLAFPGAGVSSCSTGSPLPTGSISGRVTGPDGLGVGGVRVQANLSATAALPTQVTTDLDGYYEMGSVPVGSYRVHFVPPPERTDLIEEWWSAEGGSPNYAGGGDVVVTVGPPTTGISARLLAGMKGTVTVTEGGVPLPTTSGRVVVLCPATTTYDFSNGLFNCADGTPVVFAQTSSVPFTYDFVNVGPGSWKIRAAEAMFFPNRLGPEATLTLAEGDTFSCVLPIDAGTPSCTVTPAGSNDGDGILPEVEADAPNVGDGNDDGTPDSQQPDVTSLNDPDAGYVTLAVGQPVGATTPQYTLADVTVQAPQSPPPGGATPQTSLVGFTIEGLPTGGAGETVELEVFLPTEANQYWKYDAVADVWTNATSLIIDGPTEVTIGGETRWRAVLQLTDGGAGDQDGVVNGEIVDPGVWALGPTDTTPPEIACPAVPKVLLHAAGAILTAVATDNDQVWTVTALLATGTIGAGQTVSISATDDAGNTATVLCTYTVGVDILELRNPIDAAVVNSIKAGQTVPVMWRVVDANGQPVADPTHFVGLTSSATSCESGLPVEAIEDVATVGAGLEYLGDGVWKLNWKTSSVWRGCRVLAVSVVGDSAHAQFKLR